MTKSQLKKSDIIPGVLDGVSTNVVEVGKIRFQGRRDRNRPTQGGDSIGSCHSLAYGYIMAGTLGVALIDRDDGRRVLLSNNHVLADHDSDTETRAHAGDNVVQPGTLDGGSCTTDRIGTLKRWIPFTTAGDNEVDAAIADLNDEADALPCQVGCDIGRVNGIKELTEDDEGLEVQKCGRTTGYTTGTVLDVDVTVNINYEILTPGGIVIRTIRFVDQILLTAMSDHGDSGALILDMDEKAVGLLFAGSNTTTVANRIERVLNLLNLEFCPPPILCRIGGPNTAVCTIGGPMERVVCRVGGPFTSIFCVIGGPNTPTICGVGGPLQIRCLACGPDNPMNCGSGGPDTVVQVEACAAGPTLFIRPIDTLIDPKRLVVLDKEKIPKNMQRSLDNMLKQMAKEREA